MLFKSSLKSSLSWKAIWWSPCDYMQLLGEYLEKYTVPAGTKINDGTCKEFFSEVVERFPAAQEHYYLLDFLVKISERYREDNCAGSFVLDLVQLGVPKLFGG